VRLKSLVTPPQDQSCQSLDETLRALDDRLGSISLPGGRTIPVKNLIGWGLATAAVVIGLGRRHERGSRELPL